MATKMAVNQRAQYLDTNGNPLSMGRVTFREVDSENEKSIYADPNFDTELSNPVLLDASGFVPTSSIFYGEGNYSVLVERVTNPGEPIPNYAEEYLVPIVVGSDSILSTGNVVDISSVEELANLDIGTNSFVRCAQYYNRTVADQGGGLFKWYANSTAQANLGMIFAWTGSTTGRFFRIGDGKSIRTSWYGVAGYTGASMTNRILQADAYCTSELTPMLEFTEAEIGIVGTINIVSPVKINTGVRFTQFDNNFAAKMVFNSDFIEVDGKTQPLVASISASLSVVFLNKQMDIYPAWLGAWGDGVSDDYTSFYNLRESTGNIVIDKGYKLTASGSPSSNLTLSKLYLRDGGYIINDIDSLTINFCYADDDAYNVFRGTSGDFTNYVFNFVGYAKWFFEFTCSNDQLVSLRAALISKHLIWDRRTTYLLSPLQDCNEVFINEVKFGTLLSSDSKINFGQIIAGSYQVFTLTTVVPGYVGPKVDGAWFGANRFSTGSVTSIGIKNAILASGDGLVDFNGVELEITGTVLIPTNTSAYKIKNLNLKGDTNTILAIQFTDVDTTITDSKIDGVEALGTSSIKLLNTDIMLSDVSQNVNLTCDSVTVKGCEIKAVSGQWVGLLSASGLNGTILNDNIIEGGKVDVYISGVSQTNSVSGNTFNKIKRIGTDTLTQTYLTVTGGDRTIVNDNNFFAINNTSSIGSFNQLLFKAYNNTDTVTALVCTGNSFDAEMISSPAISATGYAASGHRAKIFGNVSGPNQSGPKATRVQFRGATANQASIEETDYGFLFPFHPDTVRPYFAGTSWAVGDSGTGTASQFAGEIISYVPIDGEASIRYKFRADNYGTLNYITMDINVEELS